MAVLENELLSFVGRSRLSRDADTKGIQDMKIGNKIPLILTTLISITLLSGCGGGGAMSNEDKVIIEKAMVAADLDWSSHKEVMIMLVDLKSSDKSAVKADFEKYFSLAEEFTGSNGLKLQSALLEVRSRIYQNMAKTLPGTKRRAVWESYLEENKKKTKEFNEKQDKLKAEILEVEKRIKARYQ